MKVAIITLFGLFNYGNRLQNYALQNALEKNGYEAETIAVAHDYNKLKGFIKKYIERTDKGISVRAKVELDREKNFKKFNDKYLNLRMVYSPDYKIPEEVGKNYDACVVGSDQVWNPLFWEDKEDSEHLYNFTLGFFGGKKISYAASFGVDSLPTTWADRMLPQIRKFDAVSVREKNGQLLLKDAGIDSEVVVDPTMLLSADEWRQVESHDVDENKKYVLCYFLGEQPDSVKEKIAEQAKTLGAEIVDIMSPENKKLYTKGPDYFLEVIDKAEMVFTDSFHACVFSILFHTPFVVFDRQHANKSNMNSRILTLLNMTGFEDAISGESLIINDDFKKADIQIEIEKNKSLQFLKAELNRS